MPEDKIDLIHPSIKIHSISRGKNIVIQAEYQGRSNCPVCNSYRLRIKDRIERCLRHESIGTRNTILMLTLRKYRCLDCGRYFRARVPGLLPYRRSTEFFRREIYKEHYNGVSQQALHEYRKIGTATIERWFHELLGRKEREFSNGLCPRVLGIDEHFFSRKDGYVTTFADLRKGKVFELALGRSEKALHRALSAMRGRDRVQVVCIDLSATYRRIVRKYFPNALIVSDRFHVVRLVNQHFLEAWKQLDPTGRKNRGLLSLMRRSSSKLKAEQKERLSAYLNENPAIHILYDMKEELHRLLTQKGKNKQQCRPLVKQLLTWINKLEESALEPCKTLGRTLRTWSNPIARMWRFRKNNAVTEGLHTKMEMIQRRAFGFKSFKNYRLRVIVMCG